MESRLAGRYQVMGEIGAGSMGCVYAARDLQTGNVVAAKVLRVDRQSHLRSVLRFQQEGTILSSLHHPNILSVHGTFMEADASCIVMDLIAGKSLREVMLTERLSLARIRHIMAQVASALAYAHDRGIVHRDVKPDNIMVGEDDHVTVTDFGIARILHRAALLDTEVALGTPLYMSPEQIEGSRLDGRSDIYAFGAVLFHLVTGRPPFEGRDAMTVAFKHVHETPPSLALLIADVPPDWEELILRALAKDPSDRFTDTRALAAALFGLSIPRALATQPCPAPLRYEKADAVEVTDELPTPQPIPVPRVAVDTLPRRATSSPAASLRLPMVLAGGVLATAGTLLQWTDGASSQANVWGISVPVGFLAMVAALPLCVFIFALRRGTVGTARVVALLAILLAVFCALTWSSPTTLGSVDLSPLLSGLGLLTLVLAVYAPAKIAVRHGDRSWSGSAQGA